MKTGLIKKIYFGTDFLNGSINRIGAYIIGVRTLQKALLYALLEPVNILQSYEKEGRLFERLAILESLKTMSFGNVWNYYCDVMGVPDDNKIIIAIKEYEGKVLSRR